MWQQAIKLRKWVTLALEYFKAKWKKSHHEIIHFEIWFKSRITLSWFFFVKEFAALITGLLWLQDMLISGQEPLCSSRKISNIQNLSMSFFGVCFTPVQWKNVCLFNPAVSFYCYSCLPELRQLWKNYHILEPLKAVAMKYLSIRSHWKHCTSM